MTRCEVCNNPIRQPATGRRRRTCSERCKKRRQRALWPPRFEDAEDALIALISQGREAPELALERIVLAWRVAA